MLLKSKEVCKWRDKCPYAGTGENKCFGVRENREGYFNCCLVNENGEFKSFEVNQGIGITSRVF